MSAPADTLVFTTDLPAPPGRVFAALTEARHLAHWFCDRATSEPGIGGELSLGWERPGATAETFTGRWEEFAPDRACAYAGGHASYPGGSAGRVLFALEPAGAGTRLLTRHVLPDRPEFDAIAARYREAWPRALARLAAYLAPGSPQMAPVTEAPDRED